MTNSDRDRLHADHLPPVLPIRPFSKPVTGRVRVPGSKSITNRALILSALSRGRTVIHNPLFSEDTRIMMDALRVLGFELKTDQPGSAIEITGNAGRVPTNGATLDIGNSGTSARFLTAFCCLAESGTFKIDGVEQMRHRPISGLVDALKAAGAQIEMAPTGGFPLEIRSCGLRGGQVWVDATGSSQALSALLMVAPCARTGLQIHLSDTRVRRPYVDMTLAMMREFGIPSQAISTSEDAFLVRPGVTYSLDTDTYAVESDASAASYFLALPAAVGGDLQIEDLKLNGLQGDASFARIIRDLGCEMNEPADGVRIARSRTDSPLSGVTFDFFQISDTFLTLAALAPLLQGSTTITGIAHTRKQETDRVSAVATELRKLGQEVVESEDALTIHPRPLREATVDTYDDHRIAMSFSILGCHDLHGDGRAWMAIRNPSTCAKTFPSFFQKLEDLRQES